MRWHNRLRLCASLRGFNAGNGKPLPTRRRAIVIHMAKVRDKADVRFFAAPCTAAQIVRSHSRLLMR
jgi:hypothetical protein